MDNRWVCDDCGAEADHEDAACDCDDTCTQHAATIKLLRAQANRLIAERDELAAEVTRIRTAALNAAALLEARTDRAARLLGADFVRREVDAARHAPNDRVERGLAELKHAPVIETRAIEFDLSDARGDE